MTVSANVLDLALRSSVVLFMVGSLGGVGLGLAPRDALVPLTQVRFMVRSLVACWLVTPAAAWLLLRAVPLEQPYATGLLLLALAPCAPFAPAVVRIARGDAAYVAAFMVVSAVSTVIIMPLAIPVLVAGLSADPLAIARPLLLFVLLPLLLGMVVRGARAGVAERAGPAVATVTNVAGCVLLLLIVFMHGRGVVDAVGSYAIAVQVVFVGVATAAAHVMGAGLPDGQRSVLTLGVGTRNLGAALAPLAGGDHDPRAIVMIAIAAPVTLAAAALTARWLARRNRSGRPVPGDA